MQTWHCVNWFWLLAQIVKMLMRKSCRSVISSLRFAERDVKLASAFVPASVNEQRAHRAVSSHDGTIEATCKGLKMYELGITLGVHGIRIALRITQNMLSCPL